MGFERNYPIKILSKQLNVCAPNLHTSRKFSTFNYPSNANVNPWFLTGFIDAEGSFGVTIDKTQRRKLGWRVQVKFQLGLHIRDLSLLLQLQQFLGGIGSIYTNTALNKANYQIDSRYAKERSNNLNYSFRKVSFINSKSS
jgi:hypothetical protein